jgi:hypothetical protein
MNGNKMKITEENKMKSVEDKLEEIGDKAVKKLDKQKVRIRLEKLAEDKKEKVDYAQQLKEGRAFIVENADRITIYKFISHEDNIGIAIGCHDLDGEGKRFNLACSHCSHGDMKKNLWSDRIARGIIGAELRKEYIIYNRRDDINGLSSMISFDKKTDPLKVINYLFLLKTSDIQKESSIFRNISFQDRPGGPFANMFSGKINCGRLHVNRKADI